MIYVVTGQPRHGKTQYVIKMLLDFIKDNDKREKEGKQAREIYCDIAGINEPSTPVQLPTVQNQWQVFGDNQLWFGEHDDPDKPDDFVCPKPASIFIYDECHKVDWIKDSSGMLSKHPTTISMNEHGHEDFIFVFITQFPQYIHTHLHGLVEQHYHAKRFNGLNQTTIYKWNEFIKTPRSKTALKDIYEKEKFRFNKKYYNCYKSASAHDSMRFKLPREWLLAGLGIAALLSVFIWRYNNSPIKTMVDNRNPDLIAAKSETIESETVDSLDDDGLAEAIDDVDQLRSKYLPSHVVEMSQSDDLVPVSVVASATDCIALNTYGERLNLSDDLCRIMVTDPTMIPRSRSDRDREVQSDDAFESDFVALSESESI